MGHPRHSDRRYWKCMRDYERDMLKFYLDETGWHVASAAEMLGIETSFMYRRMKFVGLEPRGVSPGRRARFMGKPRVERNRPAKRVRKKNHVADQVVAEPDLPDPETGN